MARRKSIRDHASAGRISIVPYRPGENFKTRHSRRLAANLQHEAKLREWCQRNGLALRITNERHHWQVTEGKFLAEWWPSSAKLVINKRWRKAELVVAKNEHQFGRIETRNHLFERDLQFRLPHSSELFKAEVTLMDQVIVAMWS